MKSAGLLESSGALGRRVSDTPMDTDDESAPEYYAVMSFRDREQLDSAYDYLSDADVRERSAHPTVHHTVANFVFTCWRDLD